MTLSLVILSALVCTCTAITREDIWFHMLTGTWLTDGENIPQLAEKLGEKKLVEFVKKTGLDTTLAKTSAPAPFTVFGPTDAAFSKLPKPIVDDLMKNNTLLKYVLLYHVLSGKVFSTQLTNEMVANSLSMDMPIRINIYNTNPKVVTAQGCPITLVDQNATNGVIHALGRVMLPPMGTVVDVVVNIPDFTTLKTAVLAAKLEGTLAGAGPFTVFAPTNEAFGKLPPGILNDLLKDKKKLTYVLEYHVLSGTYYSAGLTNGMKVKALNEVGLTVMISGGVVSIKTQDKNTAKVMEADVSITNGVIHIIDEVLMPPDMAYHL